MKTMNRNALALILIAMLCLLFLAGCQSGQADEPQDDAPMDTPVSIPAPEEDQEEVPGLSSEDFAAIRASVPYGGLQLDSNIFNMPRSENIPVFIDVEDETGMGIMRYVNTIRVDNRTIPSIDYLSDGLILLIAINATTPFAASPDNHRGIMYLPELEPIAAAMPGVEEFWLKEHIEQSIKLLFGDVVLENMQISNGDHYLDDLTGVYYKLPRHGFDIPPYSVTLSYEDLGERYRVVVYISLSHFTGYYMRTPWQSDDPEDTIVYGRDEDAADILLAHVQDPANQFYLYLIKRDDGSLLFERQVPVL